MMPSLPFSLFSLSRTPVFHMLDFLALIFLIFSSCYTSLSFCPTLWEISSTLFSHTSIEFLYFAIISFSKGKWLFVSACLSLCFLNVSLKCECVYIVCVSGENIMKKILSRFNDKYIES